MATDISPTILTYAAKAAAEAGLTNVETIEADGEALGSLPAGSFDAVICRVGLIYFPDQQKALAGIRRALRDGGRMAAIVYSTPPATSSSPSRCRSPATGPSSLPRSRASPGRSASGRPASSRRR